MSACKQLWASCICWQATAHSKRMTRRKRSAYVRHSWRSLDAKVPSQLRESLMYNSSNNPEAPALHGRAPYGLFTGPPSREAELDFDSLDSNGC